MYDVSIHLNCTQDVHQIYFILFYFEKDVHQILVLIKEKIILYIVCYTYYIIFIIENIMFSSYNNEACVKHTLYKIATLEQRHFLLDLLTLHLVHIDIRHKPNSLNSCLSFLFLKNFGLCLGLEFKVNLFYHFTYFNYYPTYFYYCLQVS